MVHGTGNDYCLILDGKEYCGAKGGMCTASEAICTEEKGTMEKANIFLSRR
jgi:hypothetical protein